MDWCRTHLSTISKKGSKNLSFHETLGGASKTCTLNFKVQKDVFGEEKNIKKRQMYVHNRITLVVFTVHF